MIVAGTDDIEDFLAGYPASIAELGRALRSFVREAAPDSAESLHLGWKVIAFGRARKFCAVAPHANWVNLQFHDGAALDDPDGLLTGTGKSMRHVKVAGRDALDGGLRALIADAARRAG